MAEDENVKQADDAVVTEVNLFSPELIQQQVDAIIRSVLFRNAPALQRLLQFVTSKTITGQQEHLKEYTIGVEAFDRGADYDPKIDTVVRVEMHRLRQKLKEYYEAEGSEDPIVIKIPKGHYYASFKPRSPTTAGGLEGEDSSQPQQPSRDHSLWAKSAPETRSQSAPEPALPFFRSRTAIGVLALAILVAGILIGSLWGGIDVGGRYRDSAIGTDSLQNGPPSLVREFWSSFVGNDAHPVLGFAQAVFLIDKTNDLFRFRHGASNSRGSAVDPHLAEQYASNPALVSRAGPLYYESGYTGVGDIEGIARMTQILTQMGYVVTVKRCRLISVDDLRSHNVILLGSSFQNDAVSQLPEMGDFVYKSPPVGDELWNGEILDRHPLPGESASYKTERDPVTGVIKADYALITVEPGITPGQYIANLGALDTSGVDGAARFMTSERGVAEIMARLHSLGVKSGLTKPPFFQALLKVNLEDGLDVLNERLLAVHLIHLNADNQSASPTPTASNPKGH